MKSRLLDKTIVQGPCKHLVPIFLSSSNLKTCHQLLDLPALYYVFSAASHTKVYLLETYFLPWSIFELLRVMKWGDT